MSSLFATLTATPNMYLNISLAQSVCQTISLCIITVGLQGVNITSWAQVKASGAVANEHSQLDYANVVCCERSWEDCKPVNVMSPNYTQQLLQGD